MRHPPRNLLVMDSRRMQSGNIRIVLEQSTDLINWTMQPPGYLPPSTIRQAVLPRTVRRGVGKSSSNQPAMFPYFPFRGRRAHRLSSTGWWMLWVVVGCMLANTLTARDDDPREITIEQPDGTQETYILLGTGTTNYEGYNFPSDLYSQNLILMKTNPGTVHHPVRN